MTDQEIRTHVREIGRICAGRANVVVEIGNELSHGSQSPSMGDGVFLAELAAELRNAGFNGPRAYGAAAVDEPDESGRYAGAGLEFSTSHLDRGRDLWNRPRRVREIFAIVEGSGAPALDNEAIGADELDGALTGRQRSNDPAEFAVYGALDRGFPGVGGVHHSQAGLHAELPGPVQQACADAYVAAHRAVDKILAGQPGDYRNSNQGGSPVGKYSDHDWANNIVRHYSFGRASVQIGVRPGVIVPWVDGWRESRAIYEVTAADGRMLRVLEATR